MNLSAKLSSRYNITRDNDQASAVAFVEAAVSLTQRISQAKRRSCLTRLELVGVRVAQLEPIAAALARPVAEGASGLSPIRTFVVRDIPDICFLTDPGLELGRRLFVDCRLDQLELRACGVKRVPHFARTGRWASLLTAAAEAATEHSATAVHFSPTAVARLSESLTESPIPANWSGLRSLVLDSNRGLGLVGAVRPLLNMRTVRPRLLSPPPPPSSSVVLSLGMPPPSGHPAHRCGD